MAKRIYRYEFAASAAIADVESSILLAEMAIESIHGESDSELDLGYFLHRQKRQLIVDATTEVGRNFNRLLVGFFRREFVGNDYSVERVDEMPTQPAA
jgi:hypothetical protein